MHFLPIDSIQIPLSEHHYSTMCNHVHENFERRRHDFVSSTTLVVGREGGDDDDDDGDYDFAPAA